MSVRPPTVVLRPMKGSLVSVSLIRSQLERKKKARADAEKKAGVLRGKESGKRSNAAKAKTAAENFKNANTVKSRLTAATRHEAQANAAARDASSWGGKGGRQVRQGSRRPGGQAG